jgi:hypothetical protein
MHRRMSQTTRMPQHEANAVHWIDFQKHTHWIFEAEPNE